MARPLLRIIVITAIIIAIIICFDIIKNMNTTMSKQQKEKEEKENIVLYIKKNKNATYPTKYGR